MLLTSIYGGLIMRVSSPMSPATKTFMLSSLVVGKKILKKKQEVVKSEMLFKTHISHHLQLRPRLSLNRSVHRHTLHSHSAYMCNFQLEKKGFSCCAPLSFCRLKMIKNACTFNFQTVWWVCDCEYNSHNRLN